MTNTTDTYWDVNGSSLNTFARNLSTLEGRWGAPPLRGENVLVPGRPGRAWVRKVPDQRTITLAGWVRGANDDGTIPAESRGKFFENWIALRKLLWHPASQQSLTKRWKGTDGIVKTAVGQVEFAGGLEPSMQGDRGAAFTCDLLMADPYFYGAQQTAHVTTSGLTVVNDGDDRARAMTLTFSAAAALTNTSTGRAITVTGATVVDVMQFSATTIGPGGVSTTGWPTEVFWYFLQLGNNVLTLSAGTCDIAWQPVYL